MKISGRSGALNRRAALAAVALGCHAALGGNPAADQLVAKGDAEVAAMHPDAGLALFEQAAKADPNDPEILLRLSQQYSNLIANAKTPAEAEGFARRSLEDAKQAEALAPENAKAHLAVAVAYGRLADFEDNRSKLEDSRQVKAEADKTLQLDPKEDYAYHVLGRWNYAVATLNPVLKLLAKYIYGGMPDASLEAAVQDYQKAIALAPQRVIHHYEIARAYLALGRKGDARKEWEIELKLKPEDNESLNDQKQARQELAK
jgi:Flp pilus assembly protein TadD